MAAEQKPKKKSQDLVSVWIPCVGAADESERRVVSSTADRARYATGPDKRGPR